VATDLVQLKRGIEDYEAGGQYVEVEGWPFSEVDRASFAGNAFLMGNFEDSSIGCQVETVDNLADYSPEEYHPFLGFAHGVPANIAAVFRTPIGSSGGRILPLAVAVVVEMRSCIVDDPVPKFAVA
jgi:hypothetical protein